MSDYNSQYSGARIEELLAMIPNLAKADLSNAMTVSWGAIGYAKFNNGLLIQWGKKTSIGNYQGTIYLPLSFYDNNYSLSIGSEKGNVTDNSSWIANFVNKTASSFNYIDTYTINGQSGTSSASFDWIAIGRWK